jgi:hypothetical protein
VTEAELEIFKLSTRLLLIERLTLRNAVLFPVTFGRMPIERSRQSLVDWLTDSSQNIEAAIAQAFGYDAATIALHSEETRESVEKMTGYVNAFAEELKGEDGRQ